MPNTNASKTLQELCPNCGRHIFECSCGPLQELSKWPMSAAGPRSEAEMSSHFSVLKDGDSGSLFIKEVEVANPRGITAVGLAPGAIIGGVYKILQLLGYGAMGEVYLARHLTLEKKCALKVIPPDQVTEIGWQRFQLEARSVASLNHVNLVRVWDLGIHEQCLPFYAMEYLAGKNLAEIVSEQGPLPVEKVLDIFIQVCDGVACAHLKGVVHRDLKPANIMLVQNPSDKLEVKILDFGLAKLMKHDRYKQSLTAVGDVFGSPAYMSPEQCGGENIDLRSDIYSIGCTMFECLAGRPPFHSHVPGAVFFGHLESQPPTLKQASGQDKFPPQLEAIVAKLLQKDPEERYQSFSDLRAELENLRQQLYPQNTQPEQFSENGQFITRRQKKFRAPQYGAVIVPQKKSPIPLIAGLVVSLAAIGAGAFLYYKQPESARDKTKTATAVHQTLPSRTESAGGLTEQSQNDGKHSRRNKRAIRATEPAETSEIAEGEDHWDGTSFYKGIVKENGQKLQHWCYNSDHVPLIFLAYQTARGWLRVPLSHDKYFPADAKISVSFRSDPVYPNNRIKALADCNFDEVNFGRYNLNDVQRLAPTLAKCQSVRAIKLGSRDWSEDDSAASADIINQFPNLERLATGAELQGATLAKVKRLGQLTDLRLPRTPYLQDCLKLLGNAKNLTNLAIFNWVIPTDSLQLLKQCPTLQKLTIGRLTGSHEQFVMLAGLPRLQELQLSALRPRPDLATDVRLLKSLKVLKVPFTTDWNDAAVNDLRKQLPALQITVFTPMNGHRRKGAGRDGNGAGKDGNGADTGRNGADTGGNGADGSGNDSVGSRQRKDAARGEQNPSAGEDNQDNVMTRAD